MSSAYGSGASSARLVCFLNRSRKFMFKTLRYEQLRRWKKRDTFATCSNIYALTTVYSYAVFAFGLRILWWPDNVLIAVSEKGAR